VLLATGCASPDTGPSEDALRTSYEQRVRSLRSNHEQEVAQLKADLKIAQEESEAQVREVSRTQREVSAVRGSHRAEQASLDAALLRLKEKEIEIAGLKRQNREAGVEGATQLLKTLTQQNRKLRDELAKALAGEREPGADLSGLIRPSSLDLQRPVAHVDGQPLRRREFVEFLYRDVGAAGYIDLFVNRFLILREAKARSLEVSTVDTELWVSEQLIEQARSAGSTAKLNASLKAKGFTRKAWEARLRYQAKTVILVRQLVALHRATLEGKEAWNARLRAAYHEAFSERVSARHVFLALPPRATPAEEKRARQKLKVAKKALDRGVPFEQVATQLSEDANSNQKGGLLGTFDRKRFAQLPTLNTALFSLEVGKVSPAIRSQIGLHVVRVDTRNKAAKTFAQARQRLISRLEKEPPAEAEVSSLINALRAKASISTTLVFD
jgi:parvulin-like peptidyl-prolyl isomerase